MSSLAVLRRVSYAALAVAFTHLVFGAIVRITGSGMGCGDHWPKCYGHWFPPMDQPTLVIEWTHRLLASILVLTVASLALVAWRHRREAGVAGAGGVLRPAVAALVVVLAAAVLGAVTVKLGNAPYATVAHWTMAMALFAVLATAAIRAGALGGTAALREQGSAKTARGAMAAAGLAFLVVAMGGLTAKFPSAAVACRSFPLCGADPSAVGGAVHVQLTHRVLAYLLFFHLLGMVIALGRRRQREAPVVVTAARVAFGFVVLQIIVAASMVLLTLPPVLRSLHEAVGVSVWLGTFTFAYLARRASRIVLVPAPGDLVPSGRSSAQPRMSAAAGAGARAERGQPNTS
jgi:cytochrome c oxidase assembly protein subunit 15